MELWTKSIEVVKELGRWYVKTHDSSGNVTVIKYVKRKRDAEYIAMGVGLVLGPRNRDRDRSLELVIKDRKGVIRKKVSYGRDPRNVAG